MRISICSFILATFFQWPVTTASASVNSPRVPLYWIWHERQTDSAYTVNMDRRDRMVREQGYVDLGVLAYVDSVPAQFTRPLKCFYSSPHTNTFCSTSRSEERIIRAMGYGYVSDEGYVRIQKTEGTIALFRLTRVYGNSEDREHRFVTSENELESLRKQGWAFDGVKGYVFPTG